MHSLTFAEDELIGTRTKNRKTLIGNIYDGAEAPLLARLCKDAPSQTLLCITEDAQKAGSLAQRLRFFDRSIRSHILPAWDCLPYDRVSPSTGIMAARLRCMVALVNRKDTSPRIVFCTSNALTQRMPPAKSVIAAHRVLKAGQKTSRDNLIDYLIKNGYQRVSTVFEPGDFAVRGGLIDIFPTTSKEPARLDFFGSQLETIKSFDTASQISGEKRTSLVLRPLSEVLLDEKTAQHFSAAYLKSFGAVSNDPLFEAISQGRQFAGMEHWLPLFHQELVTIFDYLGDECAVVYDHLAREAIETRIKTIGEHFESRSINTAQLKSFGEIPYRSIDPSLLYIDEQSLNLITKEKNCFDLSRFKTPQAIPSEFDHAFNIDITPGRDFVTERQNKEINLFSAIGEHIRALLNEGHSPVVAASSKGAMERFKQVLSDHGEIKLREVDQLSQHRDGQASIAILPIDKGFFAPGLCILGEQDLLGERLSRSSIKRKRKANKFIADVASLSEGDLVVHAEHGIGRFLGLVTLELGGAPHDCLKLSYADNDKLFVPVENIEILSRYGQSDSDHALDKLGGVGWQARKARIKKRIREIADELIKVAAERQLKKGETLNLPDGVYEEFAARFPYEETEDQLKAIEAVLEDLGSGRSMDRLVCGDVGFGKTEIALRAAFVAAMSGKQVAVIAPTTLLARQHFHVFQDRYKGLPVKVAQLSRFVSAKDAAANRKALAEGKVDIIVGTHAVLAKTVTFSDLGLLIIDEEQHFGVTHKERLKQLKSDIHVLTMTATPIPRTLHMALGGMKDLSIIATPPVDRLAVRSFVTPVDPVVLREALLREHHRGGQSFYVCPRVSDQAKLSEDLKQIVPELKVAVANGQMATKDLEAVMGAFYDRELDILLATNIIESGLDIPTANTLIVHRADMFGLSQLYQLRGRVGRSKHRGYAYFTVPPNQKLRDTAERRLQVIQQLDGLGAGFQLASHDLDIRGAGNLLGDEQSGQIKEVGFELYNQMLEEAVQSLRAEAMEQEAEEEAYTPQITVDAAALIPAAYIPDIDLRLSMYKRLASLENSDELEEFAIELIDRFGDIPSETEHLLKIIGIKQQCKKARISKLDIGPKGVVMGFHQNRYAKPERLVDRISQSKGLMRIRPDHKLVLLRETESTEQRLKLGLEIAKDLADLAA